MYIKPLIYAYSMFKGRCLCCQEQIKRADKYVDISKTINDMPIRAHDYCFNRHEIQIKDYYPDFSL